MEVSASSLAENTPVSKKSNSRPRRAPISWAMCGTCAACGAPCRPRGCRVCRCSPGRRQTLRASPRAAPASRPCRLRTAPPARGVLEAHSVATLWAGALRPPRLWRRAVALCGGGHLEPSAWRPRRHLAPPCGGPSCATPARGGQGPAAAPQVKYAGGRPPGRDRTGCPAAPHAAGRRCGSRGGSR